MINIWAFLAEERVRGNKSPEMGEIYVLSQEAQDINRTSPSFE